MTRVLVADDSDAMREALLLTLSRLGYDAVGVKGGAEAVAAFGRRHFDVVVTDLRMAPVDGLEVVRRLRAADGDATVVVVTAHGSVAAAVEAMRAGAVDFLEKPFSPELLAARLGKAAEIAGERRRARDAQARAAALDEDRAREAGPLGLVGTSAAMEKLRQQVLRVAPTDASVLVLGESGTGKELVARALHAASRRRDGPFVPVSCAALPEGLLESELFGHERGAFIGALRRKIGRFELAHGGTLFLDEVGEVPPSVQVKLLRVLQERQLERVGGEETVAVDVRLVAATNRDLARLVGDGRFREDLYYRLAVVPLAAPPLRDRTEDVEPLARHFLAKHAARIGRRVTDLEPETLAVLRAHRWPGNVRELENVVQQAMVFGEGATVRAADLPAALGGPRPALPAPTGDRSLPEILDDLERQLVLAAYEQARGVKAETARLLGIKPSALYYKLDKYGIGKGSEPGEPER